MANKGIELPGLILGVIAGSAATSLIFYYRTVTNSNDDCIPARDEAIDEAERHAEPRANQQSLNDTNGHHCIDRSSNDDRNISSSSSMSDGRHRVSFAIDEEEERSFSNCTDMIIPTAGTNCHVITHSDWETHAAVIQAKTFEEKYLSKIDNKEDLEIALRRTWAVNTLAQSLTVAENEKSCLEVASTMLVPLFKIDMCAYLLKKDSETVIVNHATMSKQEYVTKMNLEGHDAERVEIPLKNSAAALCEKTLEQSYVPKTKESPYPHQKIVHRVGLNTQLNTPIIINGDKFIGCIAVYMEKEDAFSEIDRMLIKNVATILGASIHNKRLKLAAERSNKISGEILHSMIPPKVIKKIECYWDERTPEYHNRRNSSFSASQPGSLDDFDRDDLLDDEADRSAHRAPQIPQNIKDKVNLLNDMNRDVPLEHVEVTIDTSTMELTSTNRALYAETVPDVCIIFADIVNFSKISLDMKPIQVMDMLQDIFSRFDALCDHHSIQKLDTIGDAYICTTSMFDEAAGRKSSSVAANALHMAKDMVKEARKVIAKTNPIQTLEIRVGIHCGDLTYGVLGERLPKFTVFGSSVNLAARMEQTCVPNKIRVTKDFFDLLPESETLRVDVKEIISVKNMGEVETYLLDPLQDNLESSSRALYD